MVSKLLIAWGLLAFCLAIHAAGVTAALRWLRPRAEGTTRYWPLTWLLIRVAGWMVLLHLFEISVWALYYFGRGAIENVEDAFYFSAVTYTTTGYGDLVLPEAWRLAGGVEALTGILMCGWSTGFFFAVVSRLYQTQPHTSGAA